jgi:DNA-directed RNA polymerase subunit RPC12/RpoP
LEKDDGCFLGAGARERYFCVNCESVVTTGRMPKDDRGSVCPICGSGNVRLWERGKAIPGYYGNYPEEE